MNKNKYCWN